MRLTQEEIEGIAWFTLARIAGKEGRREVLPEGSFSAELAVSVSVEGREFAAALRAETTVNPDSVRVNSTAPDMTHLVALLLDRLPKAGQRRLLAGLPEQFAARGELPEVPAGMLEASRGLLARLRARVSQNVRGSVSTAYGRTPSAQK